MVAPAKLRVSWLLIAFSITNAHTCSTYIWVESDLAELIRRLLVVVVCYQALLEFFALG